MNKHIPLAMLVLLTMFIQFPELAYLNAQEPTDLNDPKYAELAYPPTDDDIPGGGPLRRNENQIKTWMTRRIHFANRGDQDNGAVVFYGDSITQGWGDDFRQQFPGVHLANRGISGDTTRGLLLRLEKDALSLKPKAMVLLIGTNDLADGIEPEVIAGNMKLLIAELKKYSDTMPIVLCQVFPSHPDRNRPADKIKMLNDLYFQVVKGDPQITFLDTYAYWAQPDGNCVPDYFPDLLHLNEQGYAKWASGLRPILTTLRLMETEPKPFTPEEGFRSLLNGKDLTGWCARDNKTLEFQASYDGLTQTPDARFRAINNGITAATTPEGRKYQVIWSKEEFPKDFVLRLQFRASPNADGGVFIRKPQLQCRDYSIAGPFKDLKNYKPQEWNDLEVTVKGTTAYCTCNGEVLLDAMPVPETGPIGFEGDRGQMEYRNVRVKELK
jgi:lysophospholipase L1-like esterase